MIYQAPGGMVTEDPTTWDARRRKRTKDNHAVLLGLYAKIGLPSSYLDLGCGIGNMVLLSARLGIYSVGVEIMLQETQETRDWRLIQGDLSKPITLYQRFDLVTCLEVAEHLPAEGADTLVETMTHHCDNRLVFTAAPKGQGGSGHVNEQPPEYWHEKIKAKGFKYTEKETEEVRAVWELVCNRSRWYPRNLMIFSRR